MGDLGDRIAASSLSKSDKLSRIAQLLEESGIDLAEVGRIDKVRIGEHQMVTKTRNAAGVDEVDVHTLRADSLLLTPTFATGPAWPVVQPAAPCVVRPPKTAAKARGDWLTAVILPDPQIGYRRDLDTGDLDPFHDEAAMAVALQIVKAADPTLVVNLGDTMDLPEWGTYEQEAGFAFTTQATVDRAHRWLVEQRAAAPRMERHELIEGNHDRRLEKAVRRNAMAAFGLRRANEPESWPVLSVPNLLRLDEVGVTYVGGYPAGVTWVNDNLACIHGRKVRSSGSTAAAVIDDERVSVVFGHVHRIELQHRTRRTRAGAKQSFAATPGCLSRIDGAVPSVKSSTDPMGRPLMSWENWQQGVAVVEYEPGDGRFNLELVPIIDGRARWRGREFTA